MTVRAVTCTKMPSKYRTQVSFVLAVSTGMIRPGTDESGVGDVSIADAAVHCLTHVFV